ncbi:hypothetical protein EIN_176790 [Entamoeba invadens IP1]|uniref:hypothetical protein n=1 Tax=Entamoeba invadens IP1 TaxID=370355 RepID=UPI0002C3D7F2|nr:hypothetical protein EIN_176790 [Entamoeba invadens IP1]ELP93852.1 hypothetical protein EIN_176790 [Entamoeba invadens IP1]|eukprot:XP_004260623.1 hypothetical protein EIN_176790 [Entamoeba invadens IP1]
MGSSVVSRLVGMKYPVGVMSQKDDVEDEVKKATKRRKMEILELKDQDGAIDSAKLRELSPIGKEKEGTYDVRIFYCREYAFRIREFLGEQICVVPVAFPGRRSNLNIDKNEGTSK